MPDYSEAQKRAINTRGTNVLVSASAGSGKTTVMIARILDLIGKEDATLDKMLVCTFTKASASDMKEKLQRKLLESLSACEKIIAYDKAVKAGSKRISTSEEEKINELKKKYTDPQKTKALYDEALSVLPFADISTIDSWCQKIVKTYFYVINVDPSFTLLDERESASLLTLAVDKTVQDFLTEADESFMYLYEVLVEKRKDVPLKSLLTAIYNFAQTQTEPVKWVENSTRLYTNEQDYNVLLDAFTKKVISGLLAKYEIVLEKLKSYPSAYSKILTEYENIKYDGEWKSISISAKDCDDQAVKGSINKLRLEKRKVLNNLNDCVFQEVSTEYADVLIRLTKRVMQTYSELKDNRASLDFSDLEHYTYEILKDDTVRKDVKEKYRYVFVDEYQDTNPLQNGILQAIKTEDNLFFVGDIKQSIYAFRNCDPSIFDDLYNNYEKNGFGKPIDFIENHRCGKAIVDFVNKVFCPLMTNDFGSVNYKNNQLVWDPNQGEGYVDTFVCVKRKVAPIENDYDLITHVNDDKAEENLASYIVSNILEEIKNERRRPQDIAVLSPKRTKTTVAIYKKLKAQGIPVNYSVDAYYTDKPYVKLLIELLNCINNGKDEIPFVSLLTSPIIGATLSEVERIHDEYFYPTNFIEKAKIYAGITDGKGAVLKKKNAKEDNASVEKDDIRIAVFDENNEENAREKEILAEKIKKLTDMIDKYRSLSSLMPVGELLGLFTAETDYFNRTLINYGGDACSVLADFLDMTNGIVYADNVYNFLTYIGSGGDKYEVKLDSESVNIMTMHGSKGLEFPVVYVLFAEPKAEQQAFAKYSKDTGLATKIIDEDEKQLQESGLYVLTKSITERKMLEEKMRLLYVALTRAKEKLHICKVLDVKDVDEVGSGNLAEQKKTMWSWVAPHVDPASLIIESKPYKNDDSVPTRIVLSKPDEELAQMLNKQFAKTLNVENKKIKTSVTAIASQQLTSEQPLSSAQNLDEEKQTANVKHTKKDKRENVSATDLGSAYHKVMEKIDFSLPFIDAFEKVKAENIDNFEFVVKEKIEKAYDAVMPYYVGGKIYREKKFMYKQDGLLVQGVIDLLVIKDNRAYVIDYKTTSLRNLAKQETMAEYRKQTEIYASAVNKILGFEIGGIMLFSFEKGEYIQL